MQFPKRDHQISFHSGKTTAEKRENAARRCSARKYGPNFRSIRKQQHWFNNEQSLLFPTLFESCDEKRLTMGYSPESVARTQDSGRWIRLFY